MRQSSDPQFAQILNRVREGKQTDQDIKEIKALAKTDTSVWQNGFVNVYLTNHRVNLENERCIAALKEELNIDIVVINAKDSA